MGAPTLGTVLAGADGSAAALNAVRYAAALASRLNLDLVVGHVRPAPIAVADVAAVPSCADDLELHVVLQVATLLDTAGIRWRFETADGDAASGLRDIANRVGAVMIVLGTRGAGAGAFVHRLLGSSVSARLAHHERRPVLVVPACGQPLPMPPGDGHRNDASGPGAATG